MPEGANILAISVGNSRSQIGWFLEGNLEAAEFFAHDAQDGGNEWLSRSASWWEQVQSKPGAAVVIASVHDARAESMRVSLEKRLETSAYLIGDDLPIPIGTQLDEDTRPGADRLLNAAAAFDALKQACIVIDAGTAVTIDFVDGEGTFQGGAIAPGARMQLQAMHEHTARLPAVAWRRPDEETFGRGTEQAMLKGVYHGLRGLTARLIDVYAESYGAYPMVVATGGDATLLFGDDPLINRVVPHLTLLGMAVAARHALARG